MPLDIIIADDDPVVRHILGSVLKSEGHSVEEYSSGAGFLKGYSARTAKPDLIFLDLQLGDMTGAEVVPQIRARFPQARVVILSANSKEETKQLFPNLAADEFLEKPFSPVQVIEILHSIGA